MALAYLPLGLFLTYTTWTHISWGWHKEIWFLTIFFTGIALFIVYFMLSAVHWRSFTHLPPAHGRVMCIMPVYNEESHLVHEAVQALLKQTILPDVIHVVDDGSRIPIVPFEDPLIQWHRIENSGKREAQAHALNMHAPGEFDYIMTVDSDSVCDEDALEHLLRSMNDDRVQAATGMIYVRNWRTNFLTRLTDINVVTSCLLFRMSRSILGIVTPTSGALALYRSEIIYDNLDDYLNSGTAGDDRRLSFYALKRGHVVGVTEAVVETELPETWSGCFWQRTRWSKSAWLGTPFVITNMRPLVVFFYTMPLVFALLWPIVLITLGTITVRYHSTALLQGFIFWEVCAITQTLLYSMYRPSFTFRDRLHQALLAPLYPMLGLFILRPGVYYSLTQLNSTSWLTRENVPDEVIAPVEILEVEQSPTTL